jgi:hypothetical protein
MICEIQIFDALYAAVAASRTLAISVIVLPRNALNSPSISSILIVPLSVKGYYLVARILIVLTVQKLSLEMGYAIFADFQSICEVY